MEYISNTLGNLVDQTAFMNLTFGNLIMIAVACVFLYLAIHHGFEPLLLVPIAFGMLLVNIYPDIMLHAEDAANGTGGLLYYFYQLDEWSILPSLIFLGVGAMTDFGPLIANPKSFLLGAAAQFGIFAAYLGAMALGFSDKAADSYHGTNRCSGIFLYVTCADHPATDHETSYNREGKKDQNGSASSGFQTGENPVPDHCYDRCLRDPSYNSSTGWYADAW